MTEKPSRTIGEFWIRYLVVSALVAIGIGGTLALILWGTGARKLMTYSNVFFTAGAFVWIFGAIAVLNSWSFTRPRYQQPRPAEARRGILDFLLNYAFLIRCGVIGTIIMGIGIASYYLLR